MISKVGCESAMTYDTFWCSRVCQLPEYALCRPNADIGDDVCDIGEVLTIRVHKFQSKNSGLNCQAWDEELYRCQPMSITSDIYDDVYGLMMAYDDSLY